jgi:hypothetical protein
MWTYGNINGQEFVYVCATIQLTIQTIYILSDNIQIKACFVFVLWSWSKFVLFLYTNIQTIRTVICMHFFWQIENHNNICIQKKFHSQSKIGSRWVRTWGSTTNNWRLTATLRVTIVVWCRSVFLHKLSWLFMSAQIYKPYKPEYVFIFDIMKMKDCFVIVCMLFKSVVVVGMCM